jgi:hypothetical protein
MPVYTKPFGFEPVQRRDGLPYAGFTREYPIATGYATQLRRGDLVRLLDSGALAKAGDTTAIAGADTTDSGILGIFMGCSYTDAVLGKTFRTYWTASTAAADAVAMVCDDPDVVFRAVYVSGTTTVSAQTYAATIGKNLSVVQNTTATKLSDIAVSGVATTSTLPFRCVDVDRDSAASATTYTALFVTYGVAMHAYAHAAAVA